LHRKSISLASTGDDRCKAGFGFRMGRALPFLAFFPALFFAVAMISLRFALCHFGRDLAAAVYHLGAELLDL
jgi:hypothetical protein